MPISVGNTPVKRDWPRLILSLETKKGKKRNNKESDVVCHKIAFPNGEQTVLTDVGPGQDEFKDRSLQVGTKELYGVKVGQVF
jgi:hypothetical protein